MYITQNGLTIWKSICTKNEWTTNHGDDGDDDTKYYNGNNKTDQPASPVTGNRQPKRLKIYLKDRERGHAMTKTLQNIQLHHCFTNS